MLGAHSEKADVIIVGSGLAGLSCALELAERNYKVVLLETRNVVGGRTSSWIEDGMWVESGLHRYLGFYKYLPRILKRAGIDLNQILCWEDAFDVRLPDRQPLGNFSIAPFHRPYRTLQGLIGNHQFLPPLDKASLIPFFTGGLLKYFCNPKALDTVDVYQLARKYCVTAKAIERILIPLTAGIFFIPPERYSAYNFFGLLGPYLPRLHKMRLGAFMGGMTEVMANPIANAIRKLGGIVRTGVRVEELIVQNDRAVGVRTKIETMYGGHVVLATSLKPAQELLSQKFDDHAWFKPMLSIPSMPVVTIQLELSCPSMLQDKTTFSPNTVFASYSEQSRTTFRHVPGRLSIILTPPEQFIDKDPEQILRYVYKDSKRLGLHIRGTVTNYRVVCHPSDFYSLAPGNDGLRPKQQTPIPGLTLAGDYTKQIYLATMEGAAYSGIKAARIVEKSLNRENNRDEGHEDF